MKVDIKNKEPKVLHRIPVLVASSAAPETWVQDEKDALHNRMHYFELSQFEKLKELPADLNPLLWLEFMKQLDEVDDEETTPPSPKKMKIETETVSIVTEQECPPTTITDDDFGWENPLLNDPELDQLVRDVVICPLESLVASAGDDETVVVMPPIDTPPPLTLTQVFEQYQTQPPTEEDWKTMTEQINEARQREEAEEATVALINMQAQNNQADSGVSESVGLTNNEWDDLLDLH